MKIEDLLQLTLQEVLERYYALYNQECGYYYGVADIDDIDEMFAEYDIDTYQEAMVVNSLIPDEIIVNFQEDIIPYEKMEKICHNLGIPKKNKENQQ